MPSQVFLWWGKDKSGLERVVTETLLANKMDPDPRATILISRADFQELIQYAMKLILDKGYQFTSNEVVKEIRKRGYDIQIDDKQPTVQPQKQEWRKYVPYVALGLVGMILLTKK